MWVRRATDREETSRNLQEFLPKTELMREHAEHTAIALNPPFPKRGQRLGKQQEQTARREAGPAGASLEAAEDHSFGECSGTGSSARWGRCEGQKRGQAGEETAGSTLHL